MYKTIKLKLLNKDCVTRDFQDKLRTIPILRVRSTLTLKVGHLRVFQSIVLPRTFSVDMPTVITGVVFLLGRADIFSTVDLVSLVFATGSLVKRCCGAARYLIVLMKFCVVVLLPISILKALIRRGTECHVFKS